MLSVDPHLGMCSQRMGDRLAFGAGARPAKRWHRRPWNVGTGAASFTQREHSPCKHCTLGQLSDALFEVGGAYRRNM